MRAEIEIKEIRQQIKKGWFKSEEALMYQVIPHLTLTNEEKQALTSRHLWDRSLYEHFPNLSPRERELAGDVTSFQITAKMLAQPDYTIGFNDIVEAQNFVTVLEDKILPLLKTHISATATGKRVVDL